MRNQDQERAAFAWQCVEQAHRDILDHFKEYKNLSKAAPALIINNGLMQTLAFLTSKGKDHHTQLRDNILRHLARTMDLPDDFSPMMKRMVTFDSQHYRQATDETLNMLRWLRQFADTMENES